jgi:uronate dehydrogenase
VGAERVIAITGAGGNIGTTLRRGLAAPGRTIRSIDVEAPERPGTGEEVVVGDVRDLDAMRSAFEGADAVVHLAAIATEAPFEKILEHNIRGTYHVFEAARRARVRRLVFASSSHVTGRYPWGRPVGPEDPVRPDTYYGVSKVFGEALGRLYADKHGLEVICIRIVGFSPEPRDAGYLAGWLSERDAVQLFRRAIEAEGIDYLCLYGHSRNTRATWRTDGWDAIGYEPVDDAEAFAERFDAADPPYRWQGMKFADLPLGGQR